MIAEQTIEEVLAELEAGGDFEREVTALSEAQPYLLDYLTNEDVEAFTEQERQLLLFATLVIHRSVVAAERTGRGQYHPNQFTEAEERNYELLQDGKGNFRERLTPFFEQSEEEELLAFVEDLVTIEAEEETISREAREPLFVTLKTVIDVLTAPAR